eukprot:TRINITY_DN9254_c0_g1_i1.p2 TRINITY_DN9254_c0_g1~~TRINITY_DN9254_c0_g1_i1.p2  ORF type:complete len:387 (+),score=53.76 TRINITY_DN9254_c0_g1_i1:1526-2686(+)
MDSFNSSLAPKFRSDLSSKMLTSILHQPCNGVWQGTMFTEVFCQAIIKESERVVVDQPSKRPQLSNDGLHLSTFLSEWLQDCADLLTHAFVRPTRPHLVAVPKSGFVVKYSKDGSTMHLPHVDQSDLTLNICLGTVFSGGELCMAKDPVLLGEVLSTVEYLTGADEAMDDSLYHVLPNRTGQAHLHAGCHMHGARPLRSGTRYNLVCWFTLQPAVPFPFMELPVELQQHICSYLEPAELLSMSQCNRAMYQHCMSDDMWRPCVVRLQAEMLTPEVLRGAELMPTFADVPLNCHTMFMNMLRQGQAEWQYWHQQLMRPPLRTKAYSKMPHDLSLRGDVINSTRAIRMRVPAAPDPLLFPGCAQTVNADAASLLVCKILSSKEDRTLR